MENKEVKGFTKDEVEKGKGMSVLSYLGFLALIPYFAEKENKYVRYHAVQGMNFFIITAAYSVLYSILTSVIKVNVSLGELYGYSLGTTRITPWWVSLPLGLVYIAISVFAIIGIVNAVSGKAKELPLIGSIKIIKK